jgi:hypothetical protein
VYYIVRVIVYNLSVLVLGAIVLVCIGPSQLPRLQLAASLFIGLVSAAAPTLWTRQVNEALAGCRISSPDVPHQHTRINKVTASIRMQTLLWGIFLGALSVSVSVCLSIGHYNSHVMQCLGLVCDLILMGIMVL